MASQTIMYLLYLVNHVSIVSGQYTSKMSNDQAQPVWEVYEGQDYEGGDTWAVFSNKESASLCARARAAEGSQGFGPPEWKEEVPGELWRAGCFYIKVLEVNLWQSYDAFLEEYNKWKSKPRDEVKD